MTRKQFRKTKHDLKHFRKMLAFYKPNSKGLPEDDYSEYWRYIRAVAQDEIEQQHRSKPAPPAGHIITEGKKPRRIYESTDR